MGTRADFYIRKKEKIEWLASIAWDGYEIDEVSKATTEKEYLELLTEFLSKRDDATYKEDGWPWPWNNSKLTDECYVFENGVVWQMCDHDGNFKDHTTEVVFTPYGTIKHNDEGLMIAPDVMNNFCVPDMKDLKKVAIGKRSGIITISI